MHHTNAGAKARKRSYTIAEKRVQGLPLYDEFRDVEITSTTPRTEFPDYQFAYKLVQAGHLAVIPTSPFFSHPDNRLAPGLVRLAFCKDDKTLDDAIRVTERLNH